MDKLYIYSENPSAKNGRIFCFRTLLFCCLIFISQAMSSQAQLKVTEPKKNFGWVMRGELVTLDYLIENTGNAPLVITDAEVACSCTTVEFSREPLLPGQSRTIRVLFNTASVYGRQDREVLLRSNSAKAPPPLRYKGIVKNK